MRAGKRAAAWAMAGVLAAALGTSSGAVADGPVPGTTYGERVSVGMSRGEPRIALGPDAAIYVAASQPLGRDTLFKSTDGGATWRTLNVTNMPFGGGDDDVLVTPSNTVWVAGQEPGSMCESAMRGDNGGEGVFVTHPFDCGTSGVPTGVDRPWLEATQEGPSGERIFMYFNNAGTHVITATDDNGLTWNRIGTLPAGRFPGNLVVDDTANFVYAATTVRATGQPEKVVVYRSADHGVTWARFNVASLTTGDKGLNHVYLTRDTAGTLYTSWTDDPDGAGYRVWAVRSDDHGATWTTPTLVSAATGTHVLPAIDAGTPGRVAVAWYATDATGDPNLVPATAQWHPQAASSLDGGRTWTSTPVSTVVNHVGPICTKGASCSGNRRLLDFLSVEVDPVGRANVVWSDDISPGVDLLFGPVLTFFARSDPATGSLDPDPQVPEAPLAALLPTLAFAALAGTVVRRRRTQSSRAI
jgi:hypothetical protein